MKNLLAALILFCAGAIGQPQPTSVAIRNAKIVTVSGPVIAKGTVVVRNGLIEAVGDNVQPPADALVIDGDRHDGLSRLGRWAEHVGNAGRGSGCRPRRERSRRRGDCTCNARASSGART